MTDLPEFNLDRVFDAPRDLVWQAWTNPDLVHRWYGPGVETIIHAFDFKPGGFWLNEMKMGGGSNYQKVVFQEIVEPEKIVWHHCSADAQWHVAANPMMPDWPRILLTTILFDEQGGRTTVRLSQTPLEATDAEIACFAKMKDAMKGGWGKGYEVIDQVLSELGTDGA
ncbi:MAG: SRPBCC family protein [Burkholderiaceae bacterium]